MAGRKTKKVKDKEQGRGRKIKRDRGYKTVRYHTLKENLAIDQITIMSAMPPEEIWKS